MRMPSLDVTRQMSTSIVGGNPGEGDESLEPIIAHGSRMSWAGILRPGDEFTPAVKSQLAVIDPDSNDALKRYFGKWDSKYQRFTTNFTSSKIRVRAISPRQEVKGDGIQCILHWLDRKEIIRPTFYGDGWPKELWDTFRAHLDNLPKGTVAEKLRSFLDSDLEQKNEFVSLWRRRIKTGTLVGPDDQKGLDKYWLPVPATLILEDKTSTQCMFSWSPSATFYETLSEALTSSEANEKKPDHQNQAKYYAECVLAQLHGVNFDSPSDFIEDQTYSNRAEVRELLSSFGKLEKERISNKRFGKLDRFGSSGDALELLPKKAERDT